MCGRRGYIWERLSAMAAVVGMVMWDSFGEHCLLGWKLGLGKIESH